MLSGYPQAAELNDGGKVAFDPVSREFWLDPSQDVIEDLQNRNASRRHQAEQALKYAHQPALTKAGKRILIEANVGSLADAQLAAEAGAEGFGILRTELLFATQPTPPSVELQLENYLAIGKLVDGACTIRTWDAGADKPLPFIKHISEPNPALGERGIRAMARRPDIFTDQLRAILLAGKEIPVKILLPMVTDPAEVAWTRKLLAELHQEITAPKVPVGIMIEVPSAAIRAKDFAELVDFVSLGTNDLTQYVQAADRTNPKVSALAKQNSPAVLDLVAKVCRDLPNTPVAVCGDLASDEEVVATLIEYGVSELSVLPTMVGNIKQAVRNS